jgi:predicted dithiol-disulfide oxidoreductase (DUF899 family)
MFSYTTDIGRHCRSCSAILQTLADIADHVQLYYRHWQTLQIMFSYTTDIGRPQIMFSCTTDIGRHCRSCSAILQTLADIAEQVQLYYRHWQTLQIMFSYTTDIGRHCRSCSAILQTLADINNQFISRSVFIIHVMEWCIAAKIGKNVN